MRKALLASLVVGVGALFAWWWVGPEQNSTLDPLSDRPPATSTPPVVDTSRAPPPRACAGHRPRSADFDGDGRTDWVYLDWVQDEVAGHAMFGWCIHGRHGSFETSGMAETLTVLDLYGDGRHETLFGGNTCCGQILKLAVYSRGRVRVVERPGGRPLVLSSGFSPKDDRERWTVYGCDAEEGGALTQVVARLEGDELRLRRTRYAISETTATVIDREIGSIPDPGPRFRGRDVSETVAACIEIVDAG